MLNANALAVALETLTGRPLTVLCVHCLHDVDPHEERYAKRVGNVGYCYRCPAVKELFVVGVEPWKTKAIDVRLVAVHLTRNRRRR